MQYVIVKIPLSINW